MICFALLIIYQSLFCFFSNVEAIPQKESEGQFVYSCDNRDFLIWGGSIFECAPEKSKEIAISFPAEILDVFLDFPYLWGLTEEGVFSYHLGEEEVVWGFKGKKFQKNSQLISLGGYIYILDNDQLYLFDKENNKIEIISLKRYYQHIISAHGEIYLVNREDIVCWKEGEGEKRRGILSVDSDEDDVFLEDDEEIFFQRDQVFEVDDSFLWFNSRGIFLIEKNYKRQLSSIAFKKDDPFWVTLHDQGALIIYKESIYLYDKEDKSVYILGRHSFLKDDIVGGFCQKGQLYIVTLAGIFMWEKKAVLLSHKTMKDESEPSLQDLFRAVLKYQRLDPEKMREWERRIEKRKFMPALDISFVFDQDDFAEIYTSASTQYIFTGDDQRDVQLGVKLEWDLADIIFPISDHVSFDTRRRLRVKEVEDLLTEVNRIYFRRLRAKREYLLQEDKGEDWLFEQSLFIDEMTGLLDLYSGGWFSDELNRLKKHKKPFYKGE